MTCEIFNDTVIFNEKIVDLQAAGRRGSWGRSWWGLKKRVGGVTVTMIPDVPLTSDMHPALGISQTATIHIRNLH